MIKSSARNRDVIHPFLIGRDMLTGDGQPSEWIIDFQARTLLQAQEFPDPLERVQRLVLPTREKKAHEGKTSAGEQRSHHKSFLRYWWRHSFDRPEMIDVLTRLPRYVVCSDTTKAGREVRQVRAEALKKMKGGLRALYRTVELPGANPLKDAHALLDEAVMAVYGFSAKKDLLGQLLALNLEVAGRIERGEEVTAPGVPKNYRDPKRLVTEDCIRPV